MIQRIHMFDYCQVEYGKDLPIASQYKIVNSEDEIIGYKNYYKSWYRKLLKRRINV